MKRFKYLAISLGLLISVGCTVQSLIGQQPEAETKKESKPANFNASLPIFLPSSGPGGSGTNILAPSSVSPSGPFGVIRTPDPSIVGPLPSPTPTPFIPVIIPNINNQITIASPVPVIQVSGQLTQQAKIVPSKLNGRVFFWDTKSSAFKPLSEAKIRVNDNSSEITLESDNTGFYESTQVFNNAVTISAAKEEYIASTVTDVPPGFGRDIHLFPLDDAPFYRQENFTFDGVVANLGENGKEATVVFTDDSGSIASAVTPSQVDNTYSMNVRVKSDLESTLGSLFSYVTEDVGELTQITQYGFSPNVAVPTPPPQPVATPTPEDTSSGTDEVFPPDPTQLVLSFSHLTSPEVFGNITVKLDIPSDNNGLSGIAIHVYMNIPNRGRVLVAKYNDESSSVVNQTIRVPNLSVFNATYTVEAHSGSADKGSDIIIPNIQIGNTVSRSFLPVPEITSPANNGSTDTKPSFLWDKVEQANSYQLDVQGAEHQAFRWEAYTLSAEKTFTFPNFGLGNPGALKEQARYKFQLMAADFDFGSFNILNQSDNSGWKMPRRLQHFASKKSGDFSVQLFQPSEQNFPQGYRVSYNTVMFTTN